MQKFTQKSEAKVNTKNLVIGFFILFYGANPYYLSKKNFNNQKIISSLLKSQRFLNQQDVEHFGISPQSSHTNHHHLFHYTT